MLTKSQVSTRVTSVEQLRALFPKTAPEALGVEIISADAEGILLRMPMSDRARQPMGLLHGGISMVLAETAARGTVWFHERVRRDALLTTGALIQ